MYNSKRHLDGIRTPIHQRISLTYTPEQSSAVHRIVRTTEFYDFNPRHISDSEVDVTTCPYGVGASSAGSSSSSSSVSAGGAVAIAFVCLIVGALVAVAYVSYRKGKTSSSAMSDVSNFKSTPVDHSTNDKVFEDDYE